ncbi:unnamed protein product [Didymodactylos carnosus]|uniref:CCHC-type domain-containing protein n=1 Tax=Didymodactylos carnosus TaxID=1234261 RepID=A0A8S2F5S1_9BILA|nr:unnamed protein product [Didymodactylos carnosus]CAF4172652.1 unnamed protein product [Didymodactylos carnosus]
MDKVMYFQKGLRGRTKAEVGYRAPTILNDAIQVAITYDTVHFSKQFTTATVYDEQDKSAPSSVELNMIKSTKYRNQPQQSCYQRMHQATKEHHIKNGLCFHCHLGGHRAFDCPDKNNDRLSSSMSTQQDIHSKNKSFVINEPNDQDSRIVNRGLRTEKTEPGSEKLETRLDNSYQDPRIVDELMGETELVMYLPQVNIDIKLDKFNDSLQAYVLPLNCFDVLLGKPWLVKHNPLIN